MANAKVYLSVTDAKFLYRELKKIEPQLYKELRQNVRKDIRPLQQGIKANNIGRLRWKGDKPPKQVLLSNRMPRSKKSGKGKVASAAVLRVTAAATALTDMAGKSGKYVGKRPYAKGNGAYSAVVPSGKYKGQIGYRYTSRATGQPIGRIHRNTGGQGRGLIKGLDAYAKPSRWVWKTADKMLPSVVHNVNDTVRTVLNSANNNLRSR